MDKKNTTIGVLFILAAFASMYFSQKLSPQPPPRAPEVADTTGSSPVGEKRPGSPADVAKGTPGTISPSDAALSAPESAGPAKIAKLANEFVEVRLSDLGGAIQAVELKKYPATGNKNSNYVINGHADFEPILGFTREFPGLDRTARYQLVSESATEVVYRTVWENRVEVTRRYSLAPSGTPKTDPHVVRHETTFRNLTDQTVTLPKADVIVGTTTLLDKYDVGTHLNIVYRTDKDTVFIERGALEGGTFLGMGKMQPYNPGPVLWAAAKNNFFVTLVTPDQAASGTLSQIKPMPAMADHSGSVSGLTGAMRFEPAALAPKGESKVGVTLYAGPNEYKRLANQDVFAHDQDKVMGYTNFFFNRIFFAGIFAPLMNQLMNWTHSWVHNWGWAIIIGTLLIKIVTLPFNLTAAKSAKKMQKLAPEMKALNEKYKDNPQKRGQAMMELYKERGVNPMGGCLPMLLPLPFFVGFFAMLQAAPELRFAEFLWVKDLAGPDTVATVFGFPINILPLVLGVVMIVQMKLVPQPTTMDSDQAKMMAKMMKFMPLIYVVFCYNFSCALSLYSTCNGLFMIAQQLWVNNMKDPELKGAPVTAGGAAVRAVKNVTPKKKKAR